MILDLNIKQKLKDIYPEGWAKAMGEKFDIVEFRNLIHFKQHLKKLTPVDPRRCDVSYEEAMKDLLSNKPMFSTQDYESIRDLVRSNLHKKGLLSEDIYEAFKYSSEGVIVDIGKIIEEDPECFLTPVKSYTNYFYELYINTSYSGDTDLDTVANNCIKLLATIEELERQHIYIKVVVVDTAKNISMNNDNILVVVPLFSHKDIKTIDTMSSVINDRLLRKFMFTIEEDIYGNNLNSGYGSVIQLPSSINIGNTLNEVELFSNILDQVITQGVR